MVQNTPAPAPLDAQPASRQQRHFSPGEELANWLIHGLGLVLSIAALVLLVIFSILRGDAWHIASFTVYGVTLIALYGASTLYHALRGGRWKQFFKRLDHAAIYLLIAGTYTPFLLTHLRSPLGWALFSVIWALCAAGVAHQFLPGHAFRMTSTIVYVSAGWLILVAINPLVKVVPPGGIWLLVAGGICYTGGIIFYLWHRLRYHHAVWHAFVLAGSICHFLAVLLFLLPEGKA